MAKASEQKIYKRKRELLERAGEVFSCSPDEAAHFFTNRKSTLLILDRIKAEAGLESICSCELTQLPWLLAAYVIEGDKTTYSHSYLMDSGAAFIQNASSLLPVVILDPKPGEYVLDMCAAPGGKSIHIAKCTNNQARLIVNDTDSRRTFTMKQLFWQYGVSVEACYSYPAQYLAKHLAQSYFDKILLDAPCSGEGLIDIDKPETLNYWSTKKVKRLSKLQKQMVAQAYLLLKPGGTLVYSTCTLSPEENEEVIDWAVKKLHFAIGEIVITHAPENLLPGLTSWRGVTYNRSCSKCVRVRPNDHMEPFFACRLTKNVG